MCIRDSNKPVKGMFDKAGVSYKRYVREFKLEGEYSVKDEIKVDAVSYTHLDVYKRQALYSI